MNTQLCTLDPNTGQVTPIGPPMPLDLMGQQLAAINNDNSLYYVVRLNGHGALSHGS